MPRGRRQVHFARALIALSIPSTAYPSAGQAASIQRGYLDMIPRYRPTPKNRDELVHEALPVDALPLSTEPRTEQVEMADSPNLPHVHVGLGISDQLDSLLRVNDRLD